MSKLPLKVIAGTVLEGDLGSVDCTLLNSQRRQAPGKGKALEQDRSRGAGLQLVQKEETWQGQGLGRLKVGAPSPASRADLSDRIRT